MAPKKDSKSWQHSEAKKTLHGDICAGTIPLDQNEMSADAVYAHHKEHPDFLLSDFHDERLFTSRLKALRTKTKEKNDFKKRDAKALAEDRLQFPKPATNFRGESDWASSKAKELLKTDIDNKKHLTMKKKKLWLSKPECQEIPLDTFRGRVCQETKSRKFQACVSTKRDKKKTAGDEDRQKF